MKMLITNTIKKSILLFLGLSLSSLLGQTGKIVPWTYNQSYNAGFNTSAYEAWAYQRTQNWSTQTLPFRMLKPVGYNTGSQPYPLVIMLHGRGERGTDNNFQLLWGGQIHQQAVQSGAFPGFVVFPQEPFGYWTNSSTYNSNGSQPSTALSQVFDLVDSLVIKYNIDPDRIYVHGLSSGGTGTWASLYNRPDLFAAGLPMSAPGDLTQVSKIAPTPIWLFQGEIDTNPVRGISVNMINALRASGAVDATLTKYTEYPGVAHFTWNPAYAEPDFFPFMLRQNKKNIRILGNNPIPSAGSTALGISAGLGAYQWYKDGALIPGATSHRLEGITQAGTYHVNFKRKASSLTWVTSNPVVLTGGSTGNQPPTTSVTSPANNTAFVTPANITINANASDLDGTIAKVEFFANSLKIGEVVSAPYSFVWNAVPVGNYTLQVIATDNSNATAASTVVNISVSNPANVLPTVSITSPATNSSFTAPSDITLSAIASDVDGSINVVRFYDGATLLGVDSTAPYTYNWLNVTVGTHNVTAVAVDDQNGSTTSSVVVLQVNYAPGSAGTGLTAQYFNNLNFNGTPVLTRIDQTVNFSWGSGSPSTGVVSTNNFTTRWSGKIKAPVTGNYTFSVQGDDGVRLRINNVYVINNFIYKNSTDIGNISLNADQLYDIVLEYFEGNGDATIIMRWAYPGQASPIVVPMINLFPNEAIPTAKMDLSGISTQNNVILEMYPNPASELLNINVPILSDVVEISIQDITGILNMEKSYYNVQGEIRMPISELKNGVYLVNISTNGYSLKQKLIVQNNQ